MDHTIVETLNAVEILKREDGKYGLHDVHSGQIAFRYRTIEAARVVAADISAENDRTDAYERSKSA